MKNIIRVLHLEDNPRDAELIQNQLESGGLPCHIIVVNGKESYESALGRGEFDIILCDHNLPDYDGKSALKLAREKLPHVPVITLSGTLGEEEAVECLKLGANDYVLKQRLARLIPAVTRGLQEEDERRARLQAEEALRASEVRARELSRFNQATFDALTSHICVLAEDGTILAANAAWQAFAAANPPPPANAGIGANYLVVCDAVTGADQPMARKAVQGLRAVMRGELAEFSMEYPCHSPDTQRWFVMRATRFHGVGAVRIVIAHTSITERKLAEEALRQSEHQLRALSSRVERLREDERRRISREIHDELGQMLTGIKMDLRWMEHRLDEFGDDRRVNPILDKLVVTAELADSILETVQRIAAELRPGILDDLGLPMALHYEAARFQERTGIACKVIVPDDSLAVPPEIATAFFRIFQEALTNIARHSQATAVETELQSAKNGWWLEIRDNGKGIQGVDLLNPASLGLRGMKERARMLGGDVSFVPRAGGGTLVRIDIPQYPTRAEEL